MSFTTYDPAQVFITFGPHVIGGYADGSFVTVAKNNPDFNLMVGSAGDSCRAKSNDRSGRVTVRLLQSSLSNDFLSAQRQLDIDSPNGDGIAPLLVKDNSGRTLVSAQTAWIAEPPDADYSRETEAREWVFETNSLVQFHAGN